MTEIKLLSFFLLLLPPFFGSSQAIAKKTFVGKWAVCYSTELPDNSFCNTPFRKFELTSDGIYFSEKPCICIDVKYPVKGVWKFENETLTIKYENNGCCAMPPESYSNIVILNEDLFYYKGTSKIENPIFYYIFKRQFH